jgi:hypothetical protein
LLAGIKEKGMTRTVFAGMIILFGSLMAYSQPSPSVYRQCIPTPDTLRGKHVFTAVEQMPEYPGGISTLMKYLNNHIKESLQSGEPIEGGVVFSFIVGADGKVIRPSICQSSNSTPTEAENLLLQAIRQMPDWKAGKQNGKYVPVRFNLPLSLGPIGRKQEK